MAEYKNIDKLKDEGWATCPQCDWFYRQRTLDECPMCRHPWRQAVGYTQPPYEPPTLE
jgi:hypothetical protein